MDPRTEVHRVAKDESSEEDERLSTGARSVDEEGDSDRGSSNSKKRKRGSYRCSRCGMPKRGHNCPDTLENVHFAIVDTPTTPAATGAQVTTPTSASKTALNGAAASSSLDDCSRETLVMHLNSLQEENMRLVQENARLHEMCQFQAHALHSIHPEFARAPNTPQGAARQNSGPVNGFPMMQQHPGFAQAPGFVAHGPQARPNFAGPSPVPQAPTSAAMPLVPNALPNSVAKPLATAQGASSQVPVFLPALASGTAHPLDERPPSAKRPKVDEAYVHNNHFMVHSSYPVHAPFPPEHIAEMQAHLYHQRPIPVHEHSSHPFDLDYERNDWLENDSSTSEYYSTQELSPALIY